MRESAFWLARGDKAQRQRDLESLRHVEDGEAFPAKAGGKKSGVAAACSATLIMLENRPLHNMSSYWTKVIALNYLYATRHGYGFHLMAPRKSGSAAKGVYYSCACCPLDPAL